MEIAPSRQISSADILDIFHCSLPEERGHCASRLQTLRNKQKETYLHNCMYLYVQSTIQQQYDQLFQGRSSTTGLSFFSFRRKCTETGNAKKMRWVLSPPGICFMRLQHSSIGSNRQNLVPLGLPRLLERRPYLASLHLARQSPRRLENSCRFRVDISYVGETALSVVWTSRELSLCTALSATSHGMGMTLGMTLIYLAECRVATRRTRLTHTARLPDVLHRCGTFPRCGIFFFRYLPGLKKIRETGKKVRLKTTVPSNPVRTAVAFWGYTSPILSRVSP